MSLREIVLRGDMEEARSLLASYGTDAHIKVNNVTDDTWGTSVLHCAINTNNIEMATLLLDHGACINRRDKFGRSPLWFASCYSDKIDIVRLLLDRGAWISSADFETGRSPLHQAAWNGNVDIATLLLDKCASVNIGDRASLTPLHLAIERDHPDMVGLLLERGGDVNASGGFWSDSPLQLATRNGSTAMKELFKPYISAVLHH